MAGVTEEIAEAHADAWREWDAEEAKAWECTIGDGLAAL